MDTEEKLLCWDCNGILKRVHITETYEEPVLGSLEALLSKTFRFFDANLAAAKQ
jgi:hypothetical protein